MGVPRLAREAPLCLLALLFGCGDPLRLDAFDAGTPCSVNQCGSCEVLPAQPGDSCPAGEWACTTDHQLVCGAKLGVPSGLVASTDRSELVHITWDAVADATGYRVMRDGAELAILPASPTFDDLKAPPAPPPSPPQSLAATQGDHTDRVSLTWLASRTPHGRASYMVAAVRGTQVSLSSAPAIGYRSALPVERYEVAAGGGAWRDVGLSFAYDDATAAAGRIAPGSATASRGSVLGYFVRVAENGALAVPGTPVNYQVRARTAPSASDAASAAGFRGVGPLSSQWQKSAADLDGAYSDVPGATSATFDDLTPPADGAGRFYRAALHAVGANDEFTLPARGYRLAFTQVTAGSSHSCALKSDGAALCWGDNSYLQSEVPPATQFISIAAGWSATCGIRADGTLLCWGPSQLSAAPSGTFTTVVVGNGFACARRTDATVACWGPVILPSYVLPTGTFQSISAGTAACGVRTNGTLACWGDNSYGQAIPPAGTFVAVSVGTYASCAVATDSTVRCWGLGAQGAGAPPADQAIDIAVGIDATNCALRTNGTGTCWNAHTAYPPQPVGVFRSISAGGWAKCGITVDGKVSCWDGPGDGFLMGSFKSISVGGHVTAIQQDDTLAKWPTTPNFQDSLLPGTFRSVSASSSYDCGIRTNGTSVCWGNIFGNGGGTFTEYPLNGSFSKLSVGRGVCGLLVDGKISCPFGNYPSFTGYYSDLANGGDYVCALRAADGTIACGGTNTPVPPGGSFASISAHTRYACALAADGAPTCWDGGSVGPPLGGFFQTVAAGDSFACGLRSGGNAECWGNLSSATGMVVVPAGPFTALASGTFACGLRPDTSVACWGGYITGE
jgi:hypothetical protein